VNHGLSVSRVGGRGQNSRQKKLTQTLFKRMIEHQQAAEFARFGSELSAESQTAMEVGRRIYEAFKQPPDEIYTLIEQELFLTAVIKTSTDVTFNVNSTKTQACQLAKYMQGDGDIDEAIDTLILSNSMEVTAEVEEVAEPPEPVEPEPEAKGNGEGKRKPKTKDKIKTKPKSKPALNRRLKPTRSQRPRRKLERRRETPRIDPARVGTNWNHRGLDHSLRGHCQHGDRKGPRSNPNQQKLFQRTLAYLLAASR